MLHEKSRMCFVYLAAMPAGVTSTLGNAKTAERCVLIDVVRSSLSVAVKILQKDFEYHR